MRIRKVLLMALVVGLVFSVGTAQAKTFVSIATGGTGGTYYPIGGGIADVVSRYAEDIQATAETGNAAVANLNLLGTHSIEFAFVQNDTAWWAARGEIMFKNAFPNIRAIATLYPETNHLVVMKKANIKNIYDLKGKRVSVGAPGSGTEADMRCLLDIAGIKYDDMKVDFLDFNNTVDRMKDGQLDAGFVVGGYPVAAIMDLATTHDVDLVSFDDDFLAKLQEKYPFYIKDTIPAGTYKGIDRDVQTPAVMAMLAVDADVPEEVVYQFTKALWEHIDEVQRVHAKAQLITLETAFDGLSVPLHDGAIRYYKEIGLEIPEVK
ncbi:hypothetical protein SAMN03080603_00238 [Acetomicrobium thermoterrenum DSM 13490]|uniref:TRAP transporter solute receptor, TAXI family n=1 Tax=Acetomicrobium thermoterrenum DSM 13490 TaxID=1120987 RepID=A0A1H3DNB7_9BACT|nr:TAXI family TRAP transporter solute-binding subunit [Acetomicrobium thermoterrenum]SDX67847.1 hypothetical protein SAMN03080603_00238 [Acetomicrobium thermoterrenum DSM 13490]